MNVALASMFRNSSAYLDRYFEQVRGLQELLRQEVHTLHLILVEADSDDDTDVQLLAHAGEFDLTLVNRDNGSQWFGSIDHPDRWRAISYVCDGALEQVRDTDDVLIYVESDLIWNPHTLMELIERVSREGIDACASMCWWRGTGLFYDVWGHRKDGIRFMSTAPHHPTLSEVEGGVMTEIDSAGSCIVMRGSVARSCRFNPPELGIVGFCQDIRTHGFSLWLDPQLSVTHP